MLWNNHELTDHFGLCTADGCTIYGYKSPIFNAIGELLIHDSRYI